VALYQKVDDEWVLCQRPYVKYSGIWTACTNAYVKRSGVWVKAYSYDTTPPVKPEVGLILVEDFDTVGGKKTLKTRYIRVGVRMPLAAHDPTVPMIRVLTDYGGQAPTTPFGGTYTSQTDSSYPYEPWSDWTYGAGRHGDNSKLIYKQWPRNATDGTQLKGDTNYHFGAWAVDQNGNWSLATQAQLNIPKGGVDEPRVLKREVGFLPNATGSWKRNEWAAGRLIQQKSPRSMGLWMYGRQFPDNFSTKSRITSAQVYIYRHNDSGAANANIYMFWHAYKNTADLPATGGAIVRNQTQKLGQLAKGQGKWFDLPGQFRDDIKDGSAKGFGLDWKDPAKADANANDYSLVATTAEVPRCGEIHIIWEEDV